MHHSNTALSLVFLLAFVVGTTERVHAASLFQTAQTFSSGAVSATSIAVADMNGDGIPDIVVFNACTATNCDGTVAILLGNGDGTFQPPKTFDTSLTFASFVAVADVNGDSKMDVVVTSGASCSPTPCVGLVSVMLGNGDGTLGAPHTYSSLAYENENVELVDVNNDGKLDVVVGSRCSNGGLCGTHGAVSVLLGKGNGSFQTAKVFDSGDYGLASIAVSDVNGDGKVDVMVAHYDGQVGTLIGNGDGTFQAAELIDTGVPVNSVLAADVNHDGKPDMIVGAAFNFGQGPQVAVGVLLGNGNGAFQPIKLYNTGATNDFQVDMVAGDVNGDGKLDVIVSLNCQGFCNTSPIVVLPGNGDGTLQKAQRYYSGGANANAISIADLNGDSKPDLAVANKCVSGSDCTTGSVGILLGISGVQTTTTLTSSLNPSSYGQAVTFTASVTSVGKSIPTGTVKFFNGSSGLGTATLVEGVCALTRSNLAAGSLSITATYNGDSNSAKSTSAPLSQMVDQASTSTTISSSLNPSNQGQPVTFTAIVTSSTTHVTGSVTFTAGSVTLGVVGLNGGKAKLTTSSLPVGSSQITATYGGTSNISGSAASLTQVVN